MFQFIKLNWKDFESIFFAKSDFVKASQKEAENRKKHIIKNII